MKVCRIDWTSLTDGYVSVRAGKTLRGPTLDVIEVLPLMAKVDVIAKAKAIAKKTGRCLYVRIPGNANFLAKAS